ncbi:hypothetical protein F511_33430 [Dorcoceras hygrometricum]|uniref:Uncharacterized protein n=1 Tax=Dorcoceras hygrometricum TaxID=472368 RepID=A0A2Z7D1W7_9LAMI|nr:hypothetical protein F511_33430 [Dorcoceras hygrometricum]
MDEPVYRVAPRQSPVFALRVYQFCTVFIDYILFSRLPTEDITSLVASISSERTVLRSVQIAQNTVSVAPIVQLIDEHSSSDSTSDDISMDFADQDTAAAASISLPAAPIPDVTKALNQLRASIEQISESDDGAKHKDTLLLHLHHLEKNLTARLDAQDRIASNALDVVDVRRVVREKHQELNAKVTSLEEQVAANRHDLLDFSAQAQQTLNVITDQLSELVAYINRGGNDKKGEVSSSRTPPDNQNRGSGNTVGGGDIVRTTDIPQSDIENAHRNILERLMSADRARERERRSAFLKGKSADSCFSADGYSILLIQSLLLLIVVTSSKGDTYSDHLVHNFWTLKPSAVAYLSEHVNNFKPTEPSMNHDYICIRFLSKELREIAGLQRATRILAGLPIESPKASIVGDGVGSNTLRLTWSSIAQSHIPALGFSTKKEQEQEVQLDPDEQHLDQGHGHQDEAPIPQQDLQAQEKDQSATEDTQRTLERQAPADEDKSQTHSSFGSSGSFSIKNEDSVDSFGPYDPILSENMHPRRKIVGTQGIVRRRGGVRLPLHLHPLDASGQLLAGLTRFLEHQSESARRVRPEAVYEHFRRMSPKEFSGTTDPFLAEDRITLLEIIFDVMELGDGG